MTPPSILVPPNVVMQILTDLEELKLATKKGKITIFNEEGEDITSNSHLEYHIQKKGG